MTADDNFKERMEELGGDFDAASADLSTVTRHRSSTPTAASADALGLVIIRHCW